MPGPTTPTRRRYVDIKSALMTPNDSTGTATFISTLTSVSFSSNQQMIKDSSDDDRYPSFMVQGVEDQSGSVTLKDPLQAHNLKSIGVGTFSFKGRPEEGGTPVKITITDVKFMGFNQNAQHNAIWGNTVNFTDYAPDGQTDPLTVELDS